jgi:hypothetical protein
MTKSETAYLERAVEAVLAALPDDNARAALVLKRAMARRLCSVCPEKVIHLPAPAPLCVESQIAAA